MPIDRDGQDRGAASCYACFAHCAPRIVRRTVNAENIARGAQASVGAHKRADIAVHAGRVLDEA